MSDKKFRLGILLEVSEVEFGRVVLHKQKIDNVQFDSLEKAKDKFLELSEKFSGLPIDGQHRADA